MRAGVRSIGYGEMVHPLTDRVGLMLRHEELDQPILQGRNDS